MQAELSIFPINLEQKNHYRTGNVADEEDDSNEGEDTVHATADRSHPLETSSNQSNVREFKFPLLEKLQRNGQLQELTIIEHRRSAEVREELVPNGNGNVLNEGSLNSPTPTEAADKPDMHFECAIGSPNELKDEIHSNHRPLSNGSGTSAPSGQKVSKRRTRKTLSPNDPAEALTEMSVRGLDLFRYATINAGMYQCMECNKIGIDKTFKNKYSFQRHAFLYHEGEQRKVFPCTVCNKEFSRPDKMKNHLRMMHGSIEPKVMLYHPVELSQLHLHPQRQQHNHHQAENSVPLQQLNEEQRRRQQEHDVLKIRSVVNAINLRQLQHFQQQQHGRELNMHQSLVEHKSETPIIARPIEASSIPQRLTLNGVGNQGA